jgi:hypothetical protein
MVLVMKGTPLAWSASFELLAFYGSILMLLGERLIDAEDVRIMLAMDTMGLWGFVVASCDSVF